LKTKPFLQSRQNCQNPVYLISRSIGYILYIGKDPIDEVPKYQT